MSRQTSNICRSLRPGFTLVEVLMASFILFLFPAGALFTTIRLEKFARTQVEKMAAAAFCEDVYNRRLREADFKEVDWRDLSDSGFEAPAIRTQDGNAFECPLQRQGYSTPKYRVGQKTDSQGNLDVCVWLKWGPNYEYEYNTDENK